jgi:hypothetical protein
MRTYKKLTPEQRNNVRIGAARPHLFLAAQILKTRYFIKPKQLAKMLGITASRAGIVLNVLGWSKWNDGKYSTYQR